jgi:1-acyl-sn-glycerol-3-phosphate acyltransferase
LGGASPVVLFGLDRLREIAKLFVQAKLGSTESRPSLQENVVVAARYRLVSLWISQVARTLADICLRSFIILHVLQIGVPQDRAVWVRIIAVMLAPFILLCPVSGALSNGLPKRWILVGSAAFCLCITAMLGAVGGDFAESWFWFLNLGLLGTGHAVYSPARYALLPAAAQDARLPLNRVTGWIDVGCASGMVAGLLVTYSSASFSWPNALAVSEWESGPLSQSEPWHFPATLGVALGCDLLATLAALPVYFLSDPRRPESRALALGNFPRDSKLILKDRAAYGSLVGLACYLGMVAAALATALAVVPSPLLDSPCAMIPQSLLLAGVGAANGCLLAAIQGHPRRMLGLVPPAALGMAAALTWATIDSNCTCVWFLVGFLGAVLAVPLRTEFQSAIPADARGNGMALMNAATYLSMGGVSLSLLAFGWLDFLTPPAQLGVLAASAAGGAMFVWRALLREAIEQFGEIVLWPMYRIRAHGPGRSQMPLHGPLLVIANHTAWFDPLWLAKVLPRRLTAMMTSRFFDLPILHWLMRNVAGAIRVPAMPFRREAPELQEAVAVLDRGGCVLIFPEGAMKRHSDDLLRHFCQGVWRILRQRPTTPVVVCWIEGGWGSFTSYEGGPPTVNKHLDWRRQIDIAVDAPHVLDAALFADNHATRDYLWRACLDARRYLELEPLPVRGGEVVGS